MSQENVDVLHRGIERYNKRDINGFFELAHHLEWHSAFVAVEGSEFRGLEATREYFEEINRTWEVFQLHPREFIDAGDIVVVPCDCYGKGRARRGGWLQRAFLAVQTRTPRFGDPS